jgi:hypothetical protein
VRKGPACGKVGGAGRVGGLRWRPKTGKVAEAITATRNHPFYVRSKGFVPAGGLAVGNAVVARAGPDLVVKKVHWHRRPEAYAVYNFLVEDSHSYFVGNACGGANPNYGGLSQLSTQDLVNSLQRVAEEPLTYYPDGIIA